MKTNGEEPINPDSLYNHIGLTKREYFAAMAMQGLLADTSDRGEQYVALQSVKLADALITALNNQEK